MHRLALTVQAHSMCRLEVGNSAPGTQQQPSHLRTRHRRG